MPAFPLLILVLSLSPSLISHIAARRSHEPSTASSSTGRTRLSSIASVSIDARRTRSTSPRATTTNTRQGYPPTPREVAGQRAARQPREDRREGHRRLEPALDPHLHPPVHPLLRVLGLPDEPDAGRRLARDELRQVRAKRMSVDAPKITFRDSPVRTRPSRSCTGSRSPSRTPRSSRRWARASRRAYCSMARRAPVRPSSPAPSRVRQACRSSQSLAPTSSDVPSHRRLCAFTTSEQAKRSALVVCRRRSTPSAPPRCRRGRRPRRARASASTAPRHRQLSEGKRHSHRCHQPATCSARPASRPSISAASPHH